MSLKLHNLKPAKGAHKRRKRVGRGPGSGHGKTACRGSKGQMSRSGSSRRPGFEGGQMPLIRRIPKRGFTNIFKKTWVVVNLSNLQSFEANREVTPDALVEKRILKSVQKEQKIKILGDGDIKVPLIVYAHAFSQSARKKIESVGGRTEVLPLA